MIPEWDPALQKAGLTLAQAWENAREDREALSLAYARLFLGPFVILAPPYASFLLGTHFPHLFCAILVIFFLKK